MTETWAQVLTIVGTNLVIMLTFFGVSIGLHIHQDTKTTTILTAIQDEMKEFHTKLATQDQEFKMRLSNIEERSRNKIIDR
jgi:hypothetical protein